MAYEKQKYRRCFSVVLRFGGNMKHNGVLTGTCGLALLAVAYCVWTALGNDINVCITEGCSLYQDVAVAGLSLWWIGAAAFVVLALLALAGAARLGRLLAGLALCGDVLLLLLMAATAPCVSCLGVALFFAGVYAAFRHAMAAQQHKNAPTRRSPLILVWAILFVINAGAVARSAASLWPISDMTMGQPSVRMFFSPSCKVCRQGVQALSGHIEVAFYPVADTVDDLYRVAAMRTALDAGKSMIEAFEAARQVSPDGYSALSPDMLWLRLRLLRNKAHVYLSGSRVVPFIEYRGLPAMLTPKPRPARRESPPVPPEPVVGGQTPRPGYSAPDENFFDAAIAGQCGGSKPCVE